MGFVNQLKHAWNAFSTSDNIRYVPQTYYSSPMRNRHIPSDNSVVGNIVNRTAIDVAMLDFVHADVDVNGRYLGERTVSGLNECLTLQANLDQSAFSFKIDAVTTIFEDGVCAIVPVDTTHNPKVTGGYDIKTMRVGRIMEWFPKHIKVNLYNENTGMREDLTLPKELVAIVQNPLYSIMNEPNSTLQRLKDRLRLLDETDYDSAKQKLDLIIQLPYVVKNEQRRKQAEARRKDIEFQLKTGEYGIAYTDGTEKITQLNRPVESNLQSRVEYLTEQLYSQLGVTKELLSGMASEEVINNYYRRTVEPVAKAITEELDRKFITKTARTQGQKIMYLRSQFDFVTTSSIGDLGDKLIRNEILTSNEMRSILGYRPSDAPGADDLRNKNMPVKDTTQGIDQNLLDYDE